MVLLEVVKVRRAIASEGDRPCLATRCSATCKTTIQHLLGCWRRTLERLGRFELHIAAAAASAHRALLSAVLLYDMYNKKANVWPLSLRGLQSPYTSPVFTLQMRVQP